MILDVFFVILFGMLLGITLLVSNLQSFIEIILLNTLLIWEQRSMRLLLRKNLIAHRKRNKLTSIIYSVTLGAVIFLITSATLTLSSINTEGTFSEADVYLVGGKIINYDSEEKNDILLMANASDPVLVKY